MSNMYETRNDAYPETAEIDRGTVCIKGDASLSLSNYSISPSTPSTSNGVSPTAFPRKKSRSTSDSTSMCVETPRTLSVELDNVVPGPVPVIYKQSFPKTRRYSTKCNGIFGFEYHSGGIIRSAVIAVQPEVGHNGASIFMSGKTRKGADQWFMLNSAMTAEERGHGMFYPEYPEEVIFDHHRLQIHFERSRMTLHLNTLEWKSERLLAERWDPEGGSTLFDSIGQMHGLYHHDDLEYNLGHAIIAQNGKKSFRHIWKKLRFNSTQLLLNSFTHSLVAFGGRCTKRTMGSKEVKRNEHGQMTNSKRYESTDPRSFYAHNRPTEEELEKYWDHNTNEFWCFLRKLRKDGNGNAVELEPLKPQELKWRRKKAKKSNAVEMTLPAINIRSAMIFDHIAIIVQWHGAEEGLSVFLWDTVFGKKHRSVLYVDLQCSSFEDLHVLTMNDGVHCLNRRTGEHVVMDPVKVMGYEFKLNELRCFEKYISGWLRVKAGITKELPADGMKCMMRCLFAITPKIIS